MQPRLERLQPMLGNPLFESILWGHEYDLSRLNTDLRQRIESGQFKRLVFYGMGCSSVVSDIVKGFFLNEKIPLHVQVINDYDLDWFVDRNVMKDPTTLAIIVCYSGWSVEPCLFFETMREMTGNKNLIVLSGGGKIAHLCEEHNISIILYKLRHADREYPLYHVQQFFSIFLDLFHKLKLTPSSYHKELQDSVNFLKTEFNEATLKKAQAIAERLKNSRIALLSTADWYVTLLKQTTMFFNEIAMVPTHRNLLHEFSHTEVAAYSNPSENKDIPQNKNIEFINIDLNQDNFFRKFFYGHFFTVYVAYYLGIHSDVEGRDLISIAAKNPWWSQRNIELHPKCVDIPAELKG
uniref:Bifunctional glucose-6-phosphate/mannose-6-phosphate isomerase C-terminal domain-containing protein n=1 Tax=Fusarium oxysporum (strain Fo5176) TaxID=660025 RepID=A0A0D2XG28_FUSOF